MVRQKEKRNRNKSPAAYQQHHSNSFKPPFTISSKRLRSRGDDRLQVVSVPHFPCAREQTFDSTLQKLLSGAKKPIKATFVLVSTNPSELASAPFTSNDRSMIMGANTQLAAAARGADVDETRLYLFGKSEKEFSGAKAVMLFSSYIEVDDDDEEDEDEKGAEVKEEKNAERKGKSPSRRVLSHQKPHVNSAEVDVSLIEVEGDFVIPTGASLEGIAGYYKIRILARGGRVTIPSSAIHLTELMAETSNCAMLRDDRAVPAGENEGIRDGGNVRSLLQELLKVAKALPRPMPTPQRTPIVVDQRIQKRKLEYGYGEMRDDDTTEDDGEFDEEFDGNVSINARRRERATSARNRRLALAFAGRNTRWTRSENEKETRILKEFCRAAERLREKRKKLFGDDDTDALHGKNSESIEQGFTKKELLGLKPYFDEVREDRLVTDSSNARERTLRFQKSTGTRQDNIVRGLAVMDNVQQRNTEHIRLYPPPSSQRLGKISVPSTIFKNDYPYKSKDQSLENWLHNSPEYHCSSYATPEADPSPNKSQYSRQSHQHHLPYRYHQESLLRHFPSSPPSTVSTPSSMANDIPGLNQDRTASPPSSISTTTTFAASHHPNIATKTHHNKRTMRPAVSANSTTQCTPNNSPPFHGQRYRNRSISSTSSNVTCYGGLQRYSSTPFNSLPPSISSSPNYPRSSPCSMAAIIANSPADTRSRTFSATHTKSFSASSLLTSFNPMSLTFGVYGFKNDNDGGDLARDYGALRSVSRHGNSACTGDSLALWVARGEACDGEGDNSVGSNPSQTAALTVQALLGSKIRRPDITVTLDEGERQIWKATEAMPAEHSLVLAGGWLSGNYFYTAAVGQAQILIVRGQKQGMSNNDGSLSSSKFNLFGDKRPWSPQFSSSSSEYAVIFSNINSAEYSHRRYLVGSRFCNRNDFAASPIADNTVTTSNCITNHRCNGHTQYASEPSDSTAFSRTSIPYENSKGSRVHPSNSALSNRLPMTSSSQTEPQTQPNYASSDKLPSKSERPKLAKIAATGRHAIRPGDVIVFSTGDIRRVLSEDDVLDEAVRIAKVNTRKAAEFLIGLWKKEADHAKETKHRMKLSDDVVLVALVT